MVLRERSGVVAKVFYGLRWIVRGMSSWTERSVVKDLDCVRREKPLLRRPDSFEAQDRLFAFGSGWQKNSSRESFPDPQESLIAGAACSVNLPQTGPYHKGETPGGPTRDFHFFLQKGLASPQFMDEL